MTSANFIQNIQNNFQTLLGKDEQKALGGIDVFLKSYQERFHWRNLENNFDLVVTENNLSESFKFLKKL